VNKTHILVVDDDAAMVRLLRANLVARSYRVTTAMDGEEALRAMEKDLVDLVILDLMMPKIDGEAVCRRLREWSNIPVIVLSARGDEKSKVRCLDLGADDYLTKPFGIAEFMARVKTALRHGDAARVVPAPPSFVCGEMEINFAMRRVTVGGKEVALTPTEFSLLRQLVVNADKVLTHGMLLQSVWGNEYGSEKEYLRVFVSRLRSKLDPDVSSPRYIHTVLGVGYCFATDA